MPSPVDAYDKTDPGADTLRDAAQDLLDEMPEVGDPNLPGWGRKATVQRVADAEAERDYLRLVDEFEESRRKLTATDYVVLCLVAAGLGAMVGLAIRAARRDKREQTKPKGLVGLDLMAAQ